MKKKWSILIRSPTQESKDWVTTISGNPKETFLDQYYPTLAGLGCYLRHHTIPQTHTIPACDSPDLFQSLVGTYPGHDFGLSIRKLEQCQTHNNARCQARDRPDTYLTCRTNAPSLTILSSLDSRYVYKDPIFAAAASVSTHGQRLAYSWFARTMR